MAYRKRRRGSRKFKAMAEASVRARELARLAGPAPVMPKELPKVRRRIIIEDFDFGDVRHEFVLERCNRVDCYRVKVDGQLLPGRYGWSKVLELARKSFIRVGTV